MKKLIVAIGIILAPLASGSEKETAEITSKLTDEILVHGQAYSNLVELTKIGHRLSGSKNAEKAVEWAKKKLETYGFDKVWLQPVSVPKWERGSIERAFAVGKKHRDKLRVTALGGSVGTNGKALKASVVEVHTFDELKALGPQVKGKIIFYNRPMDSAKVNTFEAYSKAVDQRWMGANEAAKLGAVGVLVRSMNLKLDDHPHTGAMAPYEDGVAKIPAAAISTNDAEKLSGLLKKNADMQVHLELSARSLGTSPSFNVIAETTGKDKPEEIVVVSGHFDSWDLAQGAQDDGAGCMQSVEALRAIKALGLHPRRTIRAVLYMSEENGAWGGKEYAKQAKEKNEKHIAAIESDQGGFTPRGFAVEGSSRALRQLKKWGQFLKPIQSDLAVEGHGGTDIGPLKNLGTVLFGLEPDSQRYFDYHHAETDTIDAVNARELHLGASAMAILTWLLAENGI